MKCSIEHLYPDMMINPQLVKNVIKNNPEWEDIFARIWEISNFADFQDFASFIKRIFNAEINKMYRCWMLNSGKPMTCEEERKVFAEPKVYSQMVVVSKFIEYLELLGKAQHLAKSLGLERLGPVISNKNSRAARNGGRKRAENMKAEKIALRKEYQLLYEQHKKRSSGLSPHQIYMKIAKIKGKSTSHIRNIITDYKPPKK